MDISVRPFIELESDNNTVNTTRLPFVFFSPVRWWRSRWHSQCPSPKAICESNSIQWCTDVLKCFKSCTVLAFGWIVSGLLLVRRLRSHDTKVSPSLRLFLMLIQGDCITEPRLVVDLGRYKLSTITGWTVTMKPTSEVRPLSFTSNWVRTSKQPLITVLADTQVLSFQVFRWIWLENPRRWPSPSSACHGVNTQRGARVTLNFTCFVFLIRRGAVQWVAGMSAAMRSWYLYTYFKLLVRRRPVFSSSFAFYHKFVNTLSSVLSLLRLITGSHWFTCCKLILQHVHDISVFTKKESFCYA